MNQETKNHLVKEVVSSTGHSEEVVESIIDDLTEKGALNLFWMPPDRAFKAENTTLEVPKKFFMVSPLFKGMVTYFERQTFVGYEDEEGNVRVQAPNVSKLAKKIIKYAK